MFKPNLETLEDRLALSGGSTPAAVSTFTFADGGATLNIWGNNGNNNIRLFLNDAGEINGTADGQNVFLDAGTVAGITKVNINLNKGSDYFLLKIAPQEVTNLDLSINASLGKGNDTFKLFADGAILTDSSFRVNVDGGDGKDWIEVNARGGALNNAFLGAWLSGGDDKDSIICTTSHLLDANSTVQFRGWGGDGDDTVRGEHFAFAGSEGVMDAAIWGGDDHNVLRLAMAREDALDAVSIFGSISGKGGHRNNILATDNIAVYSPNGNVRRIG